MRSVLFCSIDVFMLMTISRIILNNINKRLPCAVNISSRTYISVNVTHARYMSLLNDIPKMMSAKFCSLFTSDLSRIIYARSDAHTAHIHHNMQVPCLTCVQVFCCILNDTTCEDINEPA